MKKSKLPFYYEEIIKEIFKNAKISVSNNTVDIEINNSENINYENLTTLSKLFETTKINTGIYSYSSGGGCPTCGDDSTIEQEITITIKEAKIDKNKNFDYVKNQIGIKNE